MTWARRARHRAEYLLLRLAGATDRLLGKRLADRLAAALGRLAYRPLGIRAGVVDEQLRRAFPDRDEEWRRDVARASYEHLGREAMAILRLRRVEPDDILASTEVQGVEQLAEGMAAGKGAIIVTGHFGNWEVAGAVVTALGFPLDVVARRQANPLVDRLMRETRDRLGMGMIYQDGATKKVLDSLSAGRAVALVADQDARRRGVFVPFFGRPASTHRGPASLALRSGAPLYIGYAVRRPDGGYRGEIRRIPVPPERSGDCVERLTAELTAALEAAVRRAPGQYFWQHRRWKTRPWERDPGASGYEVPGGTKTENQNEASTT